MTKVRAVKFLIFFLFVSSAYAQKIKYKDVFGLLSTKQYDAAEPFLKKYLAENTDNSNAYLFMGLILQEKSLKDDVLRNTDGSLQHMDSAILFLDKALKGIDEKELRKSKEYYVAYNRRDLRTGEFGVKLSDVQLDIENRITALRERIDKVKMVKFYFGTAYLLYGRSNELFKSIQSRYPGLRELYLRADDATVQDLQSLSLRYDSAYKAFENYRTASGNLGKTGYSQTWNTHEIKDFKADGRELTDFFQDDLMIWDYKKFADKSREVIEKEVRPIQENLVSYDIEINKLKSTLEKDSVSVKNDLTKLIDRLLGDQLKKFDPQPLPMDIFSVKIADLHYRSSVLESKKVRDSADVEFQLGMIRQEKKALLRLDSLTGHLQARNLDEEAVNYQAFIQATYNRTEILKSFVNSLKEFCERELRAKETQLARREEAVRWLINGNDSIPLVTGDKSRKYKPLAIVDKKYTAGLVYADTANAQGYFYNITPSRKPGIKVTFPVDKAGFRYSSVAASRALVSDLSEQVYFVLIYSEKKSAAGNPATLVKIYRTDGLSWSSNLTLPFVPQELAVMPETGEIEIRSGGEQKVLVDKNGKKLN